LIKIKTYKVFSTLLLYPNDELKQNIDFINEIFQEENLFPLDELKKFDLFVSYIKKNTLLDLQELYVSVFDRQKYFSLYLFEHIHGDSRERGMAMIDLGNLYKKSSFEILSGELPDYIPVFLEYLSLLSKDKAALLLGEIVNIIAVLSRRLESINSPYYIIFSFLEFLSSVKSDKEIIEKILNTNIFSNNENFDIDKNWEEPKVF